MMRTLTGYLNLNRAAPLIVLLAARFALGLAYSFVVPLWESYDEDGHFAYARYVAVHRSLLRPGDPEADQIWEKFQPPLYYLLIAPTIAWLDLGKSFPGPEINPYMHDGDAGVNYALHPDAQESLSNPTTLAVRIARAAGVALSAASVVFVYLAARCLWPHDRASALMAASLYAFWPLFLFVGSMVTNDVLVTALSAAAFYLTLRLSADGFRLRRALALGVVIGCALLAKLNAFALIPVAAIALITSLAASGPVRAARWTSRRLWIALAAVSLVIAGAIWLLSSLKFVTSHVFQLSTLTEFLRYAPGLGEANPTRMALVTSALRYAFRTYLASYGWGNLETYRWLYWAWLVGAVLASLGLILGFVRRVHGAAGNRILALMILHVMSFVAVSLALVITYQNIYLTPGRFLLPALPAVSCLLVHGWQLLIPDRWRPFIWKALGLSVALLGWSVPFAMLLPAYARPQPSAPNAKVEEPLSVFIGDEINLIGYQHPAPLVPGQDFQISLCWRAVAPLTRNYSVFLEIVGPDGQGYGRLETYPGSGNYATTLWAVNTPFCDRYTITAGKDLPAPAAARVTVSLLNGVHGQPLPVKNATGDPAGTTADIPVKVQATAPAPLLAHPVEYRFGSGIVLSGYEIQPLTQGRRGVRVSLRWEVREDVKEDYVVFVHLRDAFSTAYAQDDSQPRQDWYPTSLWRAGETILDEHSLYFSESVLPSPLDLYVGLYAPGAVVRVPVFDAQGHPLLNNEVRLAEGLSFP
jgi:4-amino-4-deoxy-L-arabinose transferase-like glycosyltransferase